VHRQTVSCLATPIWASIDAFELRIELSWAEIGPNCRLTVLGCAKLRRSRDRSPA